MTSRLVALCFDANDPVGLARFWSVFLGWELTDDPDEGFTIVPSDDTGFRLRFVPSGEPKRGPNQMHFDLTSTSLEDQQDMVARALELGAAHLDIGQGPEAEHVVMADPEGNEFCVIEPGNGFLADCGLVGALSSDGSQQVGYFWSAALGWPLVWDQDEETAIRAPYGGPKITWGGPPVNVKTGKGRLHFDLAASADDRQAEVDRLVSLGATPVDVGQGNVGQGNVGQGDVGQGDVGWVVLADPDGNEFCLR